MRRMLRKLGCLMALTLAPLPAPAAAPATPVAGPEAPAVRTPAPLPAPLDTGSLQAWADALFEPAYATRRFSGAEIVVVQDGAVVLARGYGLADPATGRAMDPASTGVRIGSTTKVVTATAIAQLLEQGRIRSLDDPANRYLKRVRLPDWKGRQITVWDLLTHRAGFEDKAFGLGTDRPVRHPIDAATIRRAMPRLVRAPGGDSVYSNFGTAVLGLIVEDVSGEPIDGYFARHIFQPLGMTQSRLDFRLTPAPTLARPYATLPNGARQPIGFVAMHPFIAPAGGITTTGLDMARFMMAHIDGERGEAARGGASILKPETFRLMHGRHVANHPATTGFGMVFIEGDWNGTHVVEHGGGWPGFQTVMLMAPERRLGVFASIVGDAPVIDLAEQLGSLVGASRLKPAADTKVEPLLSSAYVREAALRHFLGAYRPASAATTRPAGDFAGTYCRQRRSDTTLEAAFNLLGANYAVIEAAAAADGTLTIRGVPGYRQVAPGVFWNPRAGPSLLGDPTASAMFAFVTPDDQARPRAMAPLLSVDAWEQCGAAWNPKVAGLLTPLVLLLSLSGLLCLFWPATGRLAKWARVLPLAQAVGLLALPFVLLGFYATDDGLMYHLLEGRIGRFVGMAVVGNLTALLAVGIVVATVLAWRGRWWGTGGRAVARRVHYSLIGVAALALLAVLASLNLIGVHLP